MIEGNEGAAQEQETPATPTEVLVDSIDQVVTSEDAVVDDNGNVSRWFDRANNKVFVRKDSLTEDELAASKKPEGSDGGDNDNADNNPDTPEGQEEEIEEEYENEVDYILKQSGYKSETVKFKGQDLKIADLTPEQSVEIIIEEYDNQMAAMRLKLTEAENKKPELKFNDPLKDQIVEYLKTGGDIKVLAKEILSSDPAAQAKMLSDEEVVKLAITKQNPKYSKEDVDAEFKEMTDSTKARKAKSYRAELAEQKPDLSKLTQAQKDAIDAARAREMDTFKTEITAIKTKVAGKKDIGGIPVKDDVRNYILSQILPAAHDQESAFVAEIQQDTSKLFELKWWDTYGPTMLEKTREFYYKKGLEAGSKGLDKFSDEPVRTFGGQPAGNGKAGGKSQAEPKAVDEMSDDEFNRFLNSGAKF